MGLVVIAYKEFSQYVPICTHAEDLTAALPVMFYSKPGQDVIIYKKTSGRSWYISSTSSDVIPPEGITEAQIENYLNSNKLSGVIPEEGRCFLVNRVNGDLIFDLNEKRIIKWEDFGYYPGKNLYMYLMVYDVITAEGDYWSAPIITYEASRIPSALCLRYQTRNLFKPERTTLIGKDLILEMFSEYTSCEVPYGATRNWAINPTREISVYSDSQKESLQRAIERIFDGDEKGAIINNKYLSLIWVLANKRVPGLDMNILRDVAFNDEDLELYVDGLYTKNGIIVVIVWDMERVTIEKLSKEFGMSNDKFCLAFSAKKPYEALPLL